MTPSQEQHITELKNKFATMMYHKYELGTVEHPGHIKDLPVLTLLKEALNETIDQAVFLMTAIEKLENYHPSDLVDDMS